MLTLVRLKEHCKLVRAPILLFFSGLRRFAPVQKHPVHHGDHQISEGAREHRSTQLQGSPRRHRIRVGRVGAYLAQAPKVPSAAPAQRAESSVSARPKLTAQQ